MLKISLKCFKEWEEQGFVSKGIYWDLDKEYITTSLETYLHEDQTLRSRFKLSTSSVEQPFGFSHLSDREGVMWSAPTVTLPGLGTIKFRGFIDRIDAGPNGSEVMILDLKTGSSAPFEDLENDVFRGGTKLQLPIYLLAASQNLPAAEHISAAYWMVSFKGRYQVLPSTPLSWEKVEESLNAILVKIIAGMVSGLFPANPGPDEENCTFCDYDSICPIQRTPYWNKKSQTDIRLKDYLSLSETDSETNDEVNP